MWTFLFLPFVLKYRCISYETAWHSWEIGLDGIFHARLFGSGSGRMADTLALHSVFSNLMAYHLG